MENLAFSFSPIFATIEKAFGPSKKEWDVEHPLALIIEDDRDIVALFRHVLDIAGYRTEIALHGDVAMELLVHSQPDIVLMDLNLPGVPGTDIFHTIRTTPRLSKTPVVVITAHANVAESLTDEPDLVLLKPVNVEQLTNLVQRLRPSDRALEAKPNDAITGLYNRSFFISRLEYALARAKQIEEEQFAVMLLELDQFDELEAAVAEMALKETAHTLKKVLRPTDTLGRSDKARFIVLLEDVPSEEILEMIKGRVRKNLARALREMETPVRTPIRLGVSICDASCEDVEAILAQAEQALQAAETT
jgi:diguanylate cyclase (GGDEF)-like protein